MAHFPVSKVTDARKYVGDLRIRGFITFTEYSYACAILDNNKELIELLSK